MAYAGWYYVQPLTTTPLQENLLLTDTETLRELRVATETNTFRIFPAETGNWVVKQGALELYDQTYAVEELIGLLDGLRTDSVEQSFPPEPGPEVSLLGPGEQREVLSFRFPAGSPPVVRVEATGDVFALPGKVSKPLQKMLSFDTYRGKSSLAILPSEVDSITVKHRDSLLWRVPLADVPRLSKAFIAPAAAPNGPPAYADYFDEVMDRDKYFATLTLHALGGKHYIEVFRDSQWVKPYVLSGDDHPRRYFALDSLR
jgi:hypothetical protein